MSLLTSLASGTTGLSSAAAELAVVGDNLANSNTIGFKSERATFEDALAQSVIGGQGQIGLGSRLQAVQRMMTQGALANTGVATDLALQGSGFFEVKGTSGDGRSGTYLTRAGQFTVDRDGYLVNLDGLRLQGYAADPSGRVGTALGDLQVGSASSAPNPTRVVTLKANLQADAPVPAPFEPQLAASTSNFSTAVTLYDSLGKPVSAQVFFRNNGPDDPSAVPVTTTWEWHAVVDGATQQNGVAGEPTTIATGTITFDEQGRLMHVEPAVSNFNPAGAMQQQPLEFNFGDPTDMPPGTGLAGVTQFAAPSVATFVGQDGFSSGELTSVQIDKKGTVLGLFTNGQSRALGQVGVARVTAPDRLERVGGNLFAITRDSGDAVVGSAGEGGRAFISAGTLEQSNVDIAEQFVRMIAAQRAFEANSKTITTSDQLLSELIQMKR